MQGDYLAISNTQEIITLSTNAKVLTKTISNIQSLISGCQEYNLETMIYKEHAEILVSK